MAVVASLMCSCHTPEEPHFAAVDSVGITSLEARFTDGPYANDPNAAFKTLVTDVNQTEIVISIPWYYPLESNNQVTDITRMRIKAETEAGTVISPALGVRDLTKSHRVTVEMPNGRTKEYTFRGKIEKLSGTDIEGLTFVDQYGARYDGIVNNETHTILVGTPEEVLQGCKMSDIRLSPHAAITSPDPETATDIRSGDKLTVTAHNGTTAEFEIRFEIPEKVGYGMRPNSGKKIFMKYFETDYGTTLPAAASTRLAVHGNDLLMAFGDKIWVFDRFSGAKKEEVAVPNGMTIHSLVSDTAGHLLMAANAANGEHLVIYRMDSLTDTPEVFIDFDNVVDFVLSTGDIRVVGNIDEDAVITAIAPTYGAATPSPSYVAWPVVGGVVGEAQVGVITPAGQLWNPINAAVIGASTDLNDGLFSSGYYGVYNLYYFSPTENGWSIAVDTTGVITSNDNPCALSLLEFNGARYIALIKGAHFTWSFVEIFMYDASNVATMNDAQVFHMPSDVIQSSTTAANGGEDAFSDVILHPSDDGYKFSLYFIDRNWQVMGSYEFDCIKK